ncbi:MAG TPA: hypothetical protein DEF22_06540 [Leclercia adecarboxylata]|nr:hypothetical protein [Leclercia adecarboxylata]
MTAFIHPVTYLSKLPGFIQLSHYPAFDLARSGPAQALFKAVKRFVLQHELFRGSADSTPASPGSPALHAPVAHRPADISAPPPHPP